MDPIIVLQIRPFDSSSDLPRVLKMGWRLYPFPPLEIREFIVFSGPPPTLRRTPSVFLGDFREEIR